MCEREGRGNRGRWQKGESGNPAGRKPLSPVLRLVEAAERCGASITIVLPLRSAARVVTVDDTDPLPPVAA